MREFVLAASLALAPLTVAPAFAGLMPLSVGNEVLGSGGPSTAFYVGHEADDTDTVMLTMGGGVIFDNKTTAIGASAALGVFGVGDEIEFTLKDLTISDIWDTGTGSRNADGDVHADVTADPASIPGFGTLSAASRSYALNLEAPDVTFVGFEDRPAHSKGGVPGADWDYNDLVFAVESVAPVGVAEPGAFAILGVSLLMLGVAGERRRRAIVK